MTLIVPDVGERYALDCIVGKTNGNLKLKLFKNDVTPTESFTVASLTESTATGYAAKTLTAGSWTTATVSGTSTTTYAAQTFTYTAAESVYGYYVTSNDDTKLVWVERFADVMNIPSGGGSVVVTPTLGGS